MLPCDSLCTINIDEAFFLHNNSNYNFKKINSTMTKTFAVILSSKAVKVTVMAPSPNIKPDARNTM